MKFTVLLAALTIILTFNMSAFADEVTDAIDAAKAAQKEAASLGFEWRDMGKTLKKAEKAAKAGKKEKAIKLASRVSNQLDMIKKQAAIAKTAGPRF